MKLTTAEAQKLGLDVGRAGRGTGSKWRNTPTHGPRSRRYDSRAEADRAQELEQLKRTGEITEWWPQVSCYLAGVVYRVDFLVVTATPHAGDPGPVWAEDVKGVVKQQDRTNKKLWVANASVPLVYLFREKGGRGWRRETIKPDALGAARKQINARCCRRIDPTAMQTGTVY